MKQYIASLLTIALMLAIVTTDTMAQEQKSVNTSIYTYTMKDIDGNDVPLSEYKNNVLLIVNTASKCGYTPQYETLEKLYRKYKDEGLKVLAFPANNFGAQEPGTNEEIKEFCSTKFDVTFDLFSKISVKGDDIHPLYRFLTTETPYPGDIKWNFNKFLADKNGNIVARFGTKTDPMSEEVTGKVEQFLAQ